ncbi:hypothetical protein B0H14DRAFT_2450271 [Mycena olivaceomarginata]|nr:hypothetical protein B0H14DRAFT_2450271 [Mycena olivaceomarginata]
MAETLGILTGAIQLVDTALKAREYVNDFRSAPQEQHKLFVEMSHLKPLLAELQQRIVAHPSRDMLQQMITPLSNFKTTMESFTAKLRPADGRLSGFSKRLTWMLWSKTEAKEYLEEFERIKTLLNMWLVLDIWHVGQQQHEETNEMLRSIDDLAQSQKESHREIRDSIQFATEQQQARHAHATSTLENIAQKVFDQRDELIEWVSPLNFFPRQAEIFSTRQPGTGEWFLMDEKFQAWKSSPGGVLWCQGMPGAGKTILASLVVYHLETECLNENTGVACTYLNHKETEIQSPPNLLASLWRQLVFKKPIPSEIKALYAQHREKHTRPTLNQLLDQLSALVARYSKVFFIIDALDEYPEEQRYSLLKSVLSIEPRVNLMFTCRPHISSPTSLTGMQIMEIRVTESDIRSYVENQIKNRPELKEEIHQQVVYGVDGMFLLVKFQMELLAAKHTVKALREALKSMPKDLDHTYEITIQRIISQAEDDREIALRVLTWVSNAKRPLSVRELQEALSVEQDDKNFDSDNILDTDIILSVCAGLVIIDEDNHVFRLVHYTAQEYLDHVQPTQFPKAQVDITATCLTYLSLDTWTDFRADFPQELLQAHPFISYAEEYCLVHARGSPELQLKSRILDFLNHCSIRFFPKGHKEGWDPEFLESWGEIPTILVATSYDLSEIVAGLLSTERPLAKLKNTALWIGASFDAIGTVSLVINAGADIDFEFDGTTSLYRASRLGKDRVARLLVEHGADVNKVALYTARGAATTGPPEIAALYQAIARLSRRLHSERSMGFAYSLLFDGGDIHDTPLCAAAGMGASAVVLLLIENGANINGIGVYGTALLEATIHGRETVGTVRVDDSGRFSPRF